MTEDAHPQAYDNLQAIELRANGLGVYCCHWCRLQGKDRRYWLASVCKFIKEHAACPEHYEEHKGD